MVRPPKARYALIALILVAFAAARLLSPAPRRSASLFKDWRPSASGKVWTITGAPHSNHEAFVDTVGSFQPGKGRYSVRCYVYDRAARQFLPRPSQDPTATGRTHSAKRSLLSGYLPAPRVEWRSAGIRMETISFAIDFPGADASDTCFSQVTVKNLSSRPRLLSVFVAALPYQITGELYGGSAVRYDDTHHAVLVNDAVLFACDSPPDAFGAIASDNRRGRKLVDVTNYIRDGRLPRGGIAPASRTGVTSGAARYDIGLDPGETKTLSFRSPLAAAGPDAFFSSAGGEASPSDARNRFAESWFRELARVDVSLPDRRCSDAFHASLAYLIMLRHDGLPRPGPSKYKAFWVRDFAYIADALYYSGRSDLIAPGLRQIRQMQLPNGGIKPTSISGADDELDAPGQVIYTLVRHYRRTGDGSFLRDSWPTIHAVTQYIARKRRINATIDETTRGLLPPSRSAEDIGSPNIQHYWDDFWCIRGLRDAAFAADMLGHAEESQSMRSEANDLLAATMSSIHAVAGKHGISYIPNGPEDITSSAMARGTTAGLWPCEALDPTDPFVVGSFTAYWKKWVEETDGGFVHKGSFWPYAGLDLAQCYLMLGRFDRAETMLRWTIEHDPTRGFYSWSEGMDANDLTLAVGDMPHAWFCAAYINLLRNMLVRESGDDLLLFSGVPASWLAPGKEISISGFPTLHGDVTYHVMSSDTAIEIAIGPGSRPRGSYTVILPDNIEPSTVLVDGRELDVDSTTRGVRLPSSARDVRVNVTRSPAT